MFTTLLEKKVFHSGYMDCIQQRTFIPKTSLQLPKAIKAYVLKTKRKGNEVLIDLTVDIGLVISTDAIPIWEGSNIDKIRLPTFTGRYA